MSGSGLEEGEKAGSLARAYLDLLKRAVTNYLYLGGERDIAGHSATRHYDTASASWTIERTSLPATLLNAAQLDLLERCVLQIERDRIPGDLIEAGIWRGGAVIYLRGVLEAYAIGGRKVIGADSFAGIPPNTRFKHDPVDQWSDRWVATRREVEALLARFGLFDERIELVEGLFEASLPSLAERRFALIRLDSDSYDSVMTSLECLYPALAQGGIVVIDDWHLPGCRFAVDAYRREHGITDPITAEAGNGVWVKRS